MANKTVVNIDISLAINSYIGITIEPISEVVESEDYGAIGRVLKRNNTCCNFTILDLVEDIYPRASAMKRHYRRIDAYRR